MSTHPGEMDQVVTLKAPITVTDEFGAHSAWQVVADVAAKARPLRGREFFAAAATQSPASVLFEIYYRSDVRGSWRLDWMGRQLELVAAPIDVDARHRSLELYCAEVAT